MPFSVNAPDALYSFQFYLVRLFGVFVGGKGKENLKR